MDDKSKKTASLAGASFILAMVAVFAGDAFHIISIPIDETTPARWVIFFELAYLLPTWGALYAIGAFIRAAVRT